MSLIGDQANRPEYVRGDVGNHYYFDEGDKTV